MVVPAESRIKTASLRLPLRFRARPQVAFASLRTHIHTIAVRPSGRSSFRAPAYSYSPHSLTLRSMYNFPTFPPSPPIPSPTNPRLVLGAALQQLLRVGAYAAQVVVDRLHLVLGRLERPLRPLEELRLLSSWWNRARAFERLVGSQTNTHHTHFSTPKTKRTRSSICLSSASSFCLTAIRRCRAKSSAEMPARLCIYGVGVAVVILFGCPGKGLGWVGCSTDPQPKTRATAPHRHTPPTDIHRTSPPAAAAPGPPASSAAWGPRRPPPQRKRPPPPGGTWR